MRVMVAPGLRNRRRGLRASIGFLPFGGGNWDG
jgi:hypothetical protein